MSIFYLTPPSDVSGRTVIDHHNLILNGDPLFGGVIKVRLKRDNFSTHRRLDEPIEVCRGLWQWHGSMTSHWMEMLEFSLARDRLFAAMAEMFTIGRFGRGCVSQALIELNEKWDFGIDEWDRWRSIRVPEARFLIEFQGTDDITVYDDMIWE